MMIQDKRGPRTKCRMWIWMGDMLVGWQCVFFIPNYVILLITSALNGYGVVGGGLAWVFGVGGGGYWSEETSSIICESWVCLGIESNPYGKLVIGERFVAGLVSRIMCWVVSHIRPRVLKVDGYVCVCVCVWLGWTIVVGDTYKRGSTALVQER